MNEKISTKPKDIFAAYREACSYKSGIGDKGIFEQSKINERFFVGDQWYGANCSNERPLVRRNIIKRIGEYKMAVVTAAPIAVNYSADGVPDTSDMEKEIKETRAEIYAGEVPQGEAVAPEISVITAAMSDYFKTTAERLHFDRVKEEAVRNAYISGTGIMYTYWDDTIETGLYVDAAKTQKIKGDIAIELLDVENVAFGEPNNDDMQSQPYIDIAQRKDYSAVLREAKANGMPTDNIRPNGSETLLNAGTRGEQEPTDSKRVTVITRLFKEWDNKGKQYRIKAVRVTENAVIRDVWDLNLRLYPLAKFSWERRRSCIYGDSEITYLIPNQIAINRALTAAVWGMMTNGMPIMLVNGDVITGEVSNAPGQVIKVYGDVSDTGNAIRYVAPPAFSAQYENLVNDTVNATLNDSGATDSALGNVRPDNATAIIQMREAATQPMQLYVNRFYDFIEDISRIWCDFWLNYYGRRQLKITDKDGTRYVPFDPERYKSLLITARVDVGASTMWSESVSAQTLDGLLSSGIITPLQYLERFPKGIIPDVNGLIDDLKVQQGTAEQQNDVLAMLQQQYPEEYAKLVQMPPEQQQQYLQQITTQMRGMENDGTGFIE